MSASGAGRLYAAPRHMVGIGGGSRRLTLVPSASCMKRLVTVPLNQAPLVCSECS
jgi:hypothetical protein